MLAKVKETGTVLPARRHLLGMAALAAAMPQPAMTQAFPSKPVRLLVPFSAGGGPSSGGCRICGLSRAIVLIRLRAKAGARVAAAGARLRFPHDRTGSAA